MGIVRKQSIASSFYIYIGFAIGAFNVLYLFPKYLTAEQFGLTRLLQDVAMLIAMFCTFGTCPATLKFYPFYKSYLPEKKNDLPTITLVACIIGCLLFAGITPFFKEIIIRKFGERSPLFVDYFYLIYPLTISYALWYLFEASSWTIQKTVLPNFLKEIGFRLLTTIFVFLFILKLINFHQFANLFSLVYVIPVVLLFYSLIKNKYLHFQFSISTVTKRLWKQIALFSLFVFSGQFLNIVARTVDTIVLASQSKNGLSDAAVFTVATYLVTLMDVPMRGMTGIASSVIAYAWKDKDLKKIKEMYKKTALSLIIVGLAIWAILILNVNNATSFFGSRYSMLPTLLLILGLSKLIDLGTGMNAQILLSSKYWRIDFITSMCFVILSIPLNVFLVKRYNLVGSAYANLISLFVYNLTRFLFIWKLFKLQPYSKANLLSIVIAFACFAVAYIIPHQTNIFIDAILRTACFSILYSFIIIKLKVSEDINHVFIALNEKIKGMFLSIKN
jgi:O-antigen/teichoic acid export membrane protein